MRKTQKPLSSGGVVIQFQVVGLLIFSIALIAVAALVTYGLVRHGRTNGDSSVNAPIFTNSDYEVVQMKDPPAYGQLVVRDLDLEQPEEYVAYEISTNKPAAWVFDGMTPDQARDTMREAGFTADQVNQALKAGAFAYNEKNTMVQPDEQLLFSLTPPVRARLYLILGRSSANELIHFPFCFPGDSFAKRFDKSKLSPQTYSLLKAMLYPRGDAQCFSDLQVLLRRIPVEQERLDLVKALSHQSALLVGIHVWPDTDIDKLIGYWTWPSGVRLLNVRPLLESLKRRPNGGAASILYFLPPFARQRLYTYPLPAQLGDPAMDCHWTTMNFFNETPDNRFSDPKFTTDFLLKNYYQIAKPSAYGDRIFLLDKNGNAIHSAVYLADDIVFTKNGNNFAQPWMLMRLKDLIAEYTSDAPPGIAIYRDKSW